MRISTPSWVIPGTYAENLRFLADKDAITGVELLVFTGDAATNELLRDEMPVITAFAGRFTYTAHLPSPLGSAHLPLIRLLAPLVSHFIVHPEEDAASQAAFLLALREEFGPDKFLIENVVFPLFEALLRRLPCEMPLCLDSGHILREGGSVLRRYEQYAPRVREIHLHHAQTAHGETLPVDHRPLRKDAVWFREIRPVLESFTGIINLEVYDWRDTERCLAALSMNGGNLN